MLSIVNSIRERKVFPIVLLFVVICLIVESCFYFRSTSHVCQDCTTNNENQLSTTSFYYDTTSGVIRNGTGIEISNETGSRSNYPVTSSVTNTSSQSHPDIEMTIITLNKKCLQHALDNDIVEYYYYPENDKNNLDFNRQGLRTKERLQNETSKPSLVLKFVPVDVYNATILPPAICSKEVQNFMPNMRSCDYDLVRNLLKFFKHVAALTGMEYYLNYGSLLGHVRFDKRPTPWDDDIDFSVDYSTLKRFGKIFHRERKKYFGKKPNGTFYPELYVGSDRMKIFDKTKTKIRSYVWTFPFLDLFFYSVPEEDFYLMTDEEIAAFALNDASHSRYSINVSLPMILPLKKELFLGVELAVPVEASKFLSLMKYELNGCKPMLWLHRFEKQRDGLSDKKIDCNLLHGFYDF